VKVYRDPAATNEVERLATKYRSGWEAIGQFERLLSNGKTQGHFQYPGLKLRRGDEPATIWKSKVICPELGGKSAGLRYVYERISIDGEEYAVGLTVYVHQSGINENDVRRVIRQRFALFDGTSQGLRRLEPSDAVGC